MIVYLLHLSSPIGPRRVEHYLGATRLRLEERLRRHESDRGAALLRRARQLGITYRVARVWPCATKDDAFRLEILLKRRRRHDRYCLFCSGRDADCRPKSVPAPKKRGRPRKVRL